MNLERDSTDQLATAERPRVLIAECSSTLANELRGILTAAGYEVALCSDSQEALSYARRHCVDYVISDVQMHSLNYRELVFSLRRCANYHSIPFIILGTDQDMSQTPVRTQQTAGPNFPLPKWINGWVGKPVHPIRLLTTMMEAQPFACA